MASICVNVWEGLQICQCWSGKKLFPCYQDTLCPARVKNVPYFKPEWSNQTKKAQKAHPFGQHKTYIIHIREYPLSHALLHESRRRFALSRRHVSRNSPLLVTQCVRLNIGCRILDHVWKRVEAKSEILRRAPQNLTKLFGHWEQKNIDMSETDSILAISGVY